MNLSPISASVLGLAIGVTTCGSFVAGCGGHGTQSAGSSHRTHTSAATGRRGHTGQAAPSGRRGCRTSQLTITIVGTGAAGGTAGGRIRFTNSGHARCRLTGWPDVTATTAAGKTSREIKRRTTMFGPRAAAGVPMVTLAPGGAAEAVFTVADKPVARTPDATPPRTCPPMYRRLRILPPGQSRGVSLPARLGRDGYLPACSPSILVSPVVRPAQAR